jgi:Tfp pilus assembly protein PilF
MKKNLIAVLSIFLMTNAVAKAQNVSDGVRDLYAQRYQGAKATFEKILAANPNDIVATYWLGQTYLATKNVEAAKSLYEKSLLASANAPLVIVGMGQVELIENKINEARQRFEAAITMTTGKKGADPQILNAVGRAIASVYTDKEKKGDINFAITKLTEAATLKPKDNQLLAEIYVNLGDAYRKARPGEGAGDAYQNYQNAINAKSDFAFAYWKMASIFNTQRNYDLYQQYLEKAIEKDPKFAPAYYDLYYLKLGRQDFNNAEYYAKLFVENSDPGPQNDYLIYQTLYAKKQYDEAIAGAKSIISKAGTAVNPRVFRLLAYSYVEKGDTVSAKPYIDDFFAKIGEGSDIEVNPKDYALKATIYSVIPNQEAVVLKSYLDGVEADTSVENKISIAKDGIKFFEGKKKNKEAAALYETLFTVKPAADININELFGATLANYRDSNYVRSYVFASQMAERFPDQQFGWDWKFNNAQVIDTAKKDSIAVPDALGLIAFTKGDTVQYAAQIRKAAYFLAIYYNENRELDSAIKYMTLMRSATADQAQKNTIQETIKKLEDARTAQKKGSGSTGGSASPARKPEG